VDLQQVATAIGRTVAAAGVPEVAAKEQHVAGPAQYRFRFATVPGGLAKARLASGAVAARNHPGGAEVGVDVVQIQVRGAHLHGQFEAGVGQQLLGQFNRQIVRMQVATDKARPATPRSEEHTSELQSRENLVCRLLLEKK